MDFRTKKEFYSWLERETLLGNADIISVAGGIKDLLSEDDGEALFIKKQIRLSIDLHQTSRIILVPHQECGAYGGDDETAINEAKKAAELIRNEYSEIKEILLAFNNKKANDSSWEILPITAA